MLAYILINKENTLMGWIHLAALSMSLDQYLLFKSSSSLKSLSFPSMSPW